MATKVISWNTGSGNITLTYQGQGNGPITVQSDDNDIGTARSQIITVETVGGAIVKNLTVSQGACPFPVGDVKNFSYTGSYQEIELPAGQYKLQCWGAQGGSNGTNSSYSITAKSGGKGGYSEGVLTLTQKTTVRVYVGGQGSSSAGGYNGGGSTTGTSQYNASNEFGYSKMGGGGGATDIRLNDGALLSRMIVAGGGSGGAMCYKSETTTTTTTVTDWTGSLEFLLSSYGSWYTSSNTCIAWFIRNKSYVANRTYKVSNVPSGYNYEWKLTKTTNPYDLSDYKYSRNTSTYTPPSGYSYLHFYLVGGSSTSTFTVDSSYSGVHNGFYQISNGSIIQGDPSGGSGHKCVEISVSGKGINMVLSNGTTAPVVNDVCFLYTDGTCSGGKTTSGTVRPSKTVSKVYINLYSGSGYATKFIVSNLYGKSVTISHDETSSSTSTNNYSRVGGVGGGVSGSSYSTTYAGKQDAAGTGGSFGQGANQTVTNYRYCSGAGGGGWYGGGGGQGSNSSYSYVYYSGGGSGFVNTAANASYRPTGYTGLELDSGETKDGNTSFPSTSGGTETGHSGNGYAKITRLS